MSIEILKSDCLQAEVPFSVLLPEGAGPFPVLYDLHGLMRREEPYDPAPTERSFFEGVEAPFEPEMRINGQAFESPQAWVNSMGVALVKVNGGAGWYLDSPRVETSQYESHVIREVIPYVEQTFPIIGTQETRGLSGHSMGGFGIINFLCRHPELFSVAALHCASLRFMPPDDHRGSYIETLMSDEELSAAFPADFLNALLRPDLALRITVGENDAPRLIRENRTLHQFLTEQHQPHFYEETPGGHEYTPYGWEGVAWAAEQFGNIEE